MSMQDVPGGPGVFARRNDLGNVKKIQREGKNIAEASGGAYGERARNQQLASGAPTAVAAADTIPAGPMLSGLPNTEVFAPGTSGKPLSEGANGGPGAGTEVLEMPLTEQNLGASLARAMYLANPTPYLQLLVEAFNEEGISG